MIIDGETGQPITPQIGYYDGYRIADRLLEGVMFTVHNRDGKPVCTGVHPKCASYMDQFAPAQKEKWYREIEKDLLDGMDMCDLTGTKDLYWSAP